MSQSIAIPFLLEDQSAKSVAKDKHETAQIGSK